MARYRAKKRNAQLQLEMSVEQLKKEVKRLKRRYGDVSSPIRRIQYPWSIVAEVFQVLEITFQTSWPTGEIIPNVETRSVLGFCERSFSSEMAVGDLRGSEALIDQLRQYAQYFGSPKLRLQRVESMAPGVLTATANLSLTVTEFTVQYIFSQGQEYTGRDDGRSNVYQRLLGQRLECWCSLTYLFDENIVSRLESNIDMIQPLLRVLGSIRDVSEVLQHSRITAEMSSATRAQSPDDTAT
ncbi:Bzip transcription factor [Phytophthora megakarya]|uniref:Bzip transcription factor n=1 Tax=Phytophthora megakarya TaxID=4795 RepID=A0A225VT73_9STRA|nr:Bzip transcription factor [Phytophthora megakarya]